MGTSRSDDLSASRASVRGVLTALLPFLRWFPLGPGTVRADLIAGASVGMVLVPQSMAYAQLAGLPAYYGLYAAFLPVIVGALWGSSNHLATGPVAMVSLLTGASLAQFAAAGSDRFVALAIALALMVGVLQLALGLLRLGAVVSFLSHPVIVGFTNAAAIIIALSQLNKLLGVPMDRTDQFLVDVWGVLQRVGETHLPTLAIGTCAVVLMLAMRRLLPAVPAVLAAVAIGTCVSWLSGFERRTEVPVARIVDPDARSLAEAHARSTEAIRGLGAEIDRSTAERRGLDAGSADDRRHALALEHRIQVLRLEARAHEDENRVRARALRRLVLHEQRSPDGATVFGVGGEAAGAGWRIQRVTGDRVELSGGGEVVGRVPEGLPALALPRIDWSTFGMLLSTAFVITLVGFMEAISIGKALATRTRQRIDPNQELVGQGLANLVGSVAQSYPVSGSFSRSAVNLASGARTGLSSVVSAAIVLLTLLFLTPALYHLPQAVLAAIIVVAVIGLIDFPAMRHAWQAHRHDGLCAIATFVGTLAFAPHLEVGILLGAGLAIVLFLYRTMSPRVTVSYQPVGDAAGTSDRGGVVTIRFDGRLYFANVPAFEHAVLEAASEHPDARSLLVAGGGINEIDASGEDMLRQLHRRLEALGVRLVFAGLKPQVTDVLQATGLHEEIGGRAFFEDERAALLALGADAVLPGTGVPAGAAGAESAAPTGTVAGEPGPQRAV